jgi:hypothetical protein
MLDEMPRRRRRRHFVVLPPPRRSLEGFLHFLLQDAPSRVARCGRTCGAGALPGEQSAGRRRLQWGGHGRGGVRRGGGVGGGRRRAGRSRGSSAPQLPAWSTHA